MTGAGSLLLEFDPQELAHELTSRLREVDAIEASTALEAERKIKRARIAEAGFDPHGAFVYVLWGDNADHPLYVGKSTNVLARLGTHLGGEKRWKVRSVMIVRCTKAREMDRLEAHLIGRLRPLMNSALNGGAEVTHATTASDSGGSRATPA